MKTKNASDQHADKIFIPAAGHDWFLPLYDPLMKLLGAERVRRRLLEQAAIGTGNRMLDIGCGTGNLALLLKRKYPDSDVVGMDPDPKALGRAKRKLEKAGFAIQLDQGFADELPYPNASFDRVFSSFMFHHLQASEKDKALHEVRRVLKPGGSFHLVDFNVPDSGQASTLSRWLHSNRRLSENSVAQVLSSLQKAEFVDASLVEKGTMLLWEISFYRAS